MNAPSIGIDHSPFKKPSRTTFLAMFCFPGYTTKRAKRSQSLVISMSIVYSPTKEFECSPVGK